MLHKNAISDRYRLILASKSPRRRQLLEDAGFEFELADGFEVEEVYPSGTNALEVAEYLSNLKANSYPFALADRDLLITSDTVVVVNDEVLGKPADYEDGFRMLKKLSGKTHKVVTAVCLRSKEKVVSFSDICEVCFDELQDGEIDFYLNHFKPYDKAGAYGIQEWIGYVGISRIDGSFFTVMGFPIHRVYQELKKF